MNLKTNKNNIICRYLLFVVSLFINAFGIAFITKAMLGTSPITSVTYVLSMFTPFTMGVWTIILNFIFIAVELPLMKRDELKGDLKIFLFQIPVTVFFGMFIDFSMNILFWLSPASYVGKVCTLLIGCFILAAGIALEVKMNVAMAAGEYLVRVISRRLGKEFGYVKLGFDITLVLSACLLSVIFMSGIHGVREGTVIAALVVGPIVHFLTPYYRFLDKPAGLGKYAACAPRNASGHSVITIAREYGSGGHLIGEMLSKELGIKLYDKEIIEMAARDSGLDSAKVMEGDNAVPSFWLKCVLSQSGKRSPEHSLSPEDILYVAESKVIRKLAETQDCIIVGRCADFILKDYAHVVSVFCYSDHESALSRCISEYGIRPEDAASEIRRINRKRAVHYEYYTERKWGERHNYSLMVDTGCLGTDRALRLIKSAYEYCKSKKSE